MNSFRSIVETNYQQLKTLDEKTVSTKPTPDKWSKKEILGHLCDSCINNYYRFMHLQHTIDPFILTQYRQDDWVSTRNYQGDSWDNILTEWYALHQALLLILENSLAQMAKKPVIIDGVTHDYQFLAEDYFVHLQHHLDQIFS
ncbi:MAG: DinB family protein [Marinoscillum sp.]